jgi:hypothetical protein
MMNEPLNMTDYLSTLTEPTRLRIIGLLAESSQTEIEMRNTLTLPLDELRNHLHSLLSLGVIGRQDGIFFLDETAIKAFRNKQLHKPRQFFDPPEWLSPEDAAVIRKLADVDGSLKRLPKKMSQWMAVLRYLVPVFEPGKTYTEKQVNSLLMRYHHDTAILRRGLVDSGLIKRLSDGSRYWREEGS